ncbi:MAG: YbdK family carboxylate-amine ligase [Thermoleophilaceae bacterium]|nr:YbdK family carboxylate-amine ligase [Thermoleophilaceae bacterium]
MTLPDWARWGSAATPRDLTLGVEEEIMLLDPDGWSLAQEIDRVLPALDQDLGAHVTAETHKSALELRSGVHADVSGATVELTVLRAALEAHLVELGLRAAASGTHPFAVWQDTRVSTGPRYQRVYNQMRELARREPTFALHVHVGVSDPDAAIDLLNRMRGHLPMLLALSANSPMWQGRDTGLASARTPLFQAFPRVGVPRAFRGYRDWTDAVDMLLRCEALEEPTFLWWDVRPQPRFGTVEVRILDVQSTVSETAALVALVQSVARLELEDGYLPDEVLDRPELLEENRFIAARDGMDARLLDPVSERMVPARLQLDNLIRACRPHARALGCEDDLLAVRKLADSTGAMRQLELARGESALPGVVAAMAELFCSDVPAGVQVRAVDEAVPVS